ncbi:MAG: Bax inhibitor-1/YccA family protein [Elusimicrobiota bacterium]
MRTANPALKQESFTGVDTGTSMGSMTLQGTVNKTAFLLVLALTSSLWVWNKFFAAGGSVESMQAVTPWMWGGIIGGLILALVTIFKKELSPYTAPAYALVEGLFLGGISAWAEASYPGIVIQAISLTFGTLFVLLFLYKSGVIRVTEKFRMGVISATGAIFLIYMVSFIMRLFGVNMPYIHGSGLIGIGFSLFVVTIAALNLVLDFDLIERSVDAGAPSYMEWYGAFGMMVTLVWLYIEILRLLIKLQGRR